MRSHENDNPRAKLVYAMAESLAQHRLDEAEAMLHELAQYMANPQLLLTFHVLIAIQRGQARGALQYLSTLDGDPHPELRALCLHLIGDPTWHGLATLHEDSKDRTVRTAMRHLLGKPIDA